MLKDAAETLIPPEIKPATRRRLLMSAIVAAFALHIAWACGFIPGLTGFALASDMAAVTSKVDTILVLSIEERMRDLHREICAATSAGTRTILEREIAGLQKQHKELVNEFYPMPGCES